MRPPLMSAAAAAAAATTSVGSLITAESAAALAPVSLIRVWKLRGWSILLVSAGHQSLKHRFAGLEPTEQQCVAGKNHLMTLRALDTRCRRRQERSYLSPPQTQTARTKQAQAGDRECHYDDGEKLET
jgi:hypothetical protein